MLLEKHLVEQQTTDYSPMIIVSGHCRVKTNEQNLKGQGPRRRGGVTKRRADIDPVDIYVGARLRIARTLKGMSQGSLGQLEHLTFQQVQKYETGANRISASRLAHFAAHLGVHVGWFFEGLEKDQQQPQVSLPRIAPDVLCQSETRKLVQTYYRIKDERRRKTIMGIFKVLEMA